mmetsp:Transcript_96/g.266  ORF Transcript_96/g.266 Transcript_96/m.266 type:complete len:212 (-) Transcript_96:536-1171(-)
MSLSTAGVAQGAWKLGRPCGMVPTMGRMASPSAPLVAYAKATPTATITSSFISLSIFIATQNFDFDPPLIFATAFRLARTRRVRMTIWRTPSVKPSQWMVCACLAISTAVLKKPRTWGSLMPQRFLSCPCMMRTEPPVTKPLMRLCDRKRTAKAALQRPMIKRKAPLIAARREASCVRSSIREKKESWSARTMATTAPEEMDACREVPSMA